MPILSIILCNNKKCSHKLYIKVETQVFLKALLIYKYPDAPESQ